MICPYCKEEGKTSTLHSYGGTMITAMAYMPYYDEQGKYHSHDNNARSTSFRCSNGHNFGYTYANACWCGWVGREEKFTKYDNE